MPAGFRHDDHIATIRAGVIKYHTGYVILPEFILSLVSVNTSGEGRGTEGTAVGLFVSGAQAHWWP